MAFWWRCHRGTALRSLLLLAVLHRLNCLAFLAACAPVLLLTAFLLGVVLVHSDAPLAGAAEDADRHLYKKIRHHHLITTISSSDESLSSSEKEDDDVMEEEEEEEEHLVAAAEQEEEEDMMMGNRAAVAWTADDERSIQSIGSLELERDARLEKLMSRRSSLQRNLIDLDVHIPARHCSVDDVSRQDPGSAPSSLQLRHHPFHLHDDVQTDKEELLFTRHESFTTAHLLARPSRLRPYFVAAPDILDGACIMDSSNPKKSSSSPSSSSSSSSSSSAASDHQKQQQTGLQDHKVKEEAAAKAAAEEEEGGARTWDGNRIGMAVDVELISDSSDDDMSLPGGDAAVSITQDHAADDDEDEDSFEVASITQQVVAAAGHLQMRDHYEDEPQPRMASAGPSPAGSGHQHQQQQEDGEASVERDEVSEIREHQLSGPVPVVVDSSSSSPGAGARAAGSSGGKSSIKFKPPSKKAVFGFFRK